MKTKHRLMFIFPLLVVVALISWAWLLAGSGNRQVRSSNLVHELNRGGAGKSWKVERVLGRDAANLFVQGQRCYLSRTLGPR